jgi:pimeloyl-ACP methyl ester carboxylesterase
LHFLLEKNIDKTHIFGYSMGGYVGLRLALQNPNIVDSIITLGTKFNWSRESAMQEIKMLDPEKIEENVPAYAKHMEKLHSGNDWKIVMKKTAKMMIDLGEGKRLNDDELRLIHHEVLICMGELDTMVTQEESVKTANLIPGGKFRMLEGVKHPIEKVDMHLLAKVIKDFIPMHP